MRQMKKCSAIFLVLALMIGCFSGASAYAEDEPFTETVELMPETGSEELHASELVLADIFPEGDGSSASPYLISSAKALSELSAYVAEGNACAGVYFALSDDIQLNPASAFSLDSWGNVITASVSASLWSPIGNMDNPFSGTFDGCGHTVSGICIRSDKSDQGLFGVCSGASIKNLYVSGGYVSGLSYVGAIVGKMLSGTVDKCSSKCAVYASVGYCGGIAGCNGGTVQNCYNLGSVEAAFSSDDSLYAGGIVGENNGSVKYCANTALVTASSFAGGIAGMNRKSIMMCYSVGRIFTARCSGGIAGINYGEHKSDSAIINMCVYLAGTAPSDASHVAEQGSANSYDVLCLSENALRNVSNCGTFFAYSVWKTVSDSAYPYPQLSSYPFPGEWIETTTPSAFAGDGTEESPYLISSVSDLDVLRAKVSEGYAYCGQYFALMNDLCFNPISAFTRDADGYIIGSGDSAELWEPIGSTSAPFSGVFNGSGHYISGLVTDPEGNSQGLFGFIFCAEINDLSVSLSFISGATGVGAVAGIQFFGSVNNCVNRSTVTGSVSCVGGLVGAAGGSISYCANVGKVSGNEYVGGIAGIASGGAEHSKNLASVTGKSFVGGIAGLAERCTVGECSNSGFVSSAYDAGGIVGTALVCNDIYSKGINNCYNSGLVMGVFAGGIAGMNISGSVNECYNIGGIYKDAAAALAAGVSAKIGGIAGVSQGSEEGDSLILNCCFINSQALISDNAGVGTVTISTKALSDADMKKQDSYSFNFDSVWEMGQSSKYKYPTLRRASLYCSGDVNGDGRFDATDLLRLKKYLAKITADIRPLQADLNGDGTISSSDILRAKKSLAGLPAIFI